MKNKKLADPSISTSGHTFVDYVATPNKIPSIFIEFFDKLPRYSKSDVFYKLPESTSQLQKIFVILRERLGCDFSQYKKQTLIRRIEKRMAVNQIETVEQYNELLHSKPQEIHLLFKDLLIGVTCFFRDPNFFQAFNDYVLESIFTKRSKDAPLRVWVAGCSTGEEAYSLTIAILHYMQHRKLTYRLQVIATDVNDNAIQVARRAWYPENIVSDVPKEYLDTYFIQKHNGYVIKSIIREKIIFATQNVIKDPPFSQIDILSCRNLMIYFEQDLQKKLLPVFHYSLKSEGYLLLGPSESTGRRTDLYKIIDSKWKIYQSINKINKKEKNVISSEKGTQVPTAEPVINDQNLLYKTLIDATLLESYTPACVLINKDYEICYVHGRTGKYLDPAVGVANLNVIKMSRHGLKDELLLAIKEALTDNKSICKDNITVHYNGNIQKIRLSVQPLLDIHTGGTLFLIVFNDIISDHVYIKNQTITSDNHNLDHKNILLTNELEFASQDLQATIEELETSNEELKSTNEELQSANEELQSTNEELEVSLEEMQSMNEELATVNSELNNSILNSLRSDDDMSNLLSCIEAATIFVDNDCIIRRYNNIANKIFEFNSHIYDEPSNNHTSIIFDHLKDDILNVISTLIPKKMDITIADGSKWLAINITPYRTSKNIIDGAVITAIDVLSYKTKHPKAQNLLSSIDQAPRSIIITNLLARIEYVNTYFCRISGYSYADLIGKNINIIRSGKHSVEFYQNIWNTIKSHKVWNGELINSKKDGSLYSENASICAVRDDDNEIVSYILVGNAYDDTPSEARDNNG